MDELNPKICKSLEEGLTLFNCGKFFEAHEIWEKEWLDSEGDERHLLQGLIQVAAGFYKLQIGMPSGTFKLLEKGAKHLRAIPQDMYGMDLASILTAVDEWILIAKTMINEFRTNFDINKIPKLKMHSPLH